MKTINVNTNDLRVGKSPAVMQTKGIGSCVAIALYDLNKQIGGLAHISLPAKTDDEPEENLHKYAGIAVNSLLRMMEGMEARKVSIVAKVVGGGNMFPFDPDPNDDIGRLNVAAVRDALNQNQIPIVREDVLGSEGKNIRFDLSSGRVRVTGPDRREVHL